MLARTKAEEEGFSGSTMAMNGLNEMEQESSEKVEAPSLRLSVDCWVYVVVE
jgi:hypothetical protein